MTLQTTPDLNHDALKLQHVNPRIDWSFSQIMLNVAHECTNCTAMLKIIYCTENGGWKLFVILQSIHVFDNR